MCMCMCMHNVCMFIAGRVREHGGSADDKRQQSVENKDGSAF